MQIIWLPQAVKNLESIKDYIYQNSPKSASKVAKQIKQAVFTIQDQPYIGRPALVDGFRQFQVPRLPFVIPYKVYENKIIIARVFHNRQKPIDWNNPF